MKQVRRIFDALLGCSESNLIEYEFYYGWISEDLPALIRAKWSKNTDTHRDSRTKSDTEGVTLTSCVEQDADPRGPPYARGGPKRSALRVPYTRVLR